MTPKSERSLRASEFVRTRLRRVRRCRTAVGTASMSKGTNVARSWRTLFLLRSVGLVSREDIFRVSFKLIGFDISSMPDEVLEELVAILLVHDDAGGLNDIFDVLNKFATVGAKLFLVDRGMTEDVFERVVDLSVVG